MIFLKTIEHSFFVSAGRLLHSEGNQTNVCSNMKYYIWNGSWEVDRRERCARVWRLLGPAVPPDTLSLTSKQNEHPNRNQPNLLRTLTLTQMPAHTFTSIWTYLLGVIVRIFDTFLPSPFDVLVLTLLPEWKYGNKQMCIGSINRNRYNLINYCFFSIATVGI